MGDCLILNRKHDWLPEFTYTGEYELIQESTMADAVNKNWKIRFTSSGDLTFIQPNSARRKVDLFLVGGGGGSSICITGPASYHWGARAGGAGGYTRTVSNVPIDRRVTYHIHVGAGGQGVTGGGTGSTGEASYFATPSVTYQAAGGFGGNTRRTGSGDYDFSITGGNGGTGGTTALGYDYGTVAASTPGSAVDGNDGLRQSGTAGKGQRNLTGPNGEQGTTREFGESTGTLYSNGGGKDLNNSNQIGGQTRNTGYGGFANVVYPSWPSDAAAGASGIVIMRNARGR